MSDAMKYDKLVRDNIPDMMEAQGKKAITHVADDQEYERRLREKLKEEATEFYVSGREEELADILEVFYAILKFKGTTIEKVEHARKKKAEERGTFSKRLILDGVEG